VAQGFVLFTEKQGQLKRGGAAKNAYSWGSVTFLTFLTWQRRLFRAAFPSKNNNGLRGCKPKSGEGRNPAAGIGAGFCFKNQIKAEASAFVFFGG
jgi:hypothetical protein